MDGWAAGPDTVTTDVLARLARSLGARRAWVVPMDREDLCEKLGVDVSTVVSPLTTDPVACVDVRALGRERRESGGVLVVDDSIPGPWGCAAVRLGAHVAYASIGEGACVVGVSRDVERALPGTTSLIERLSTDEMLARAMESTLAGLASQWHDSSDAAQVVASYLRCHPRVEAVRYPGLRGDPSFDVAARTLEGGFGPFVGIRLEGSDCWELLACDGTDPKGQVLACEHWLASR